MNDPNLEISPVVLKQIRQLQDFDLIMLLSEINAHGWDPHGRRLLRTIIENIENGTVELITSNQ